MYYVCIAHRIHGAAIYGNMDPIIYHQYTPNVAARIQARTPQRRRSVRWPCCRSKSPAGPFRLEFSPVLGGNAGKIVVKTREKYLKLDPNCLIPWRTSINLGKIECSHVVKPGITGIMSSGVALFFELVKYYIIYSDKWIMGGTPEIKWMI